MPMHPIVFSLCHSNIQHAKFIIKICQNYCSKTSSFVKNSTDFIKKIKHLSINPEEETFISFDVGDLFTSIPILVALHIINSKISTCTSFTNVCKTHTENLSSFWNSLLPAASSASIRNSIKNNRLQQWVHLSPCHCKYLLGTL